MSAAMRTPTKRHPIVIRIARSWRQLTGGASRRIPDTDRRTLIACSGGADSSALALALAAVTREAVIAHIIHDMRPRPEALADRDAARRLADRLALPFVDGEVSNREEGGNVESAARRLRYRVLASLARANSCPFIATAHHADDQLETILMALVRGAGPRGLAGVAPSRRLARDGPILIRPMLQVNRADAEQLCREADHEWREDTTNRDTTRLRAAIRARIIPELRALRPAAATRAVQSADLLRGAARLVEANAARLFRASGTRRSADEGTYAYFWPRQLLRPEPPVVLGSLLRRCAASLSGPAGLDRIGQRQLKSVVAAIRDIATDPRTFHWSGIDVRVDAKLVEIRSRATGG